MEGNTKRALLKCILENEDSSSSDEDHKIYNSMEKTDEFVLNVVTISRQLVQKSAIENFVEVTVENYSDIEFQTHFRLNRDVFEHIKTRFEGSSVFVNLRNDKRLSAAKHILLFLWFAGHEACSFRDIADRFNVSLSTVHVVIKRVTMFVSALAEDVIVWPDANRKQKSAQHFNTKHRFPKVIGAIDGTHIIIDPPARRKDDYVDRKGQTSIVLQGICDENRKFIDIFVGYPGSVHDSRVLQNSYIYPRLQNAVKDYYILGDSAYPLKCYLLTPYRDNGHLTAAQKHFNRQLSSCRIVVEHSFGILKQRFRQLYYCKLKGMKYICHFVRACCVLHNLANECDLNFTEVIPEEESTECDDHQNTEEAAIPAKTLRDNICQEMWTQRNS